MGAFGYFQLLVDVAFCFLILLLLVGRSWRRGTGASADQETYREMISTLSALIREMKEGAAEMDRQLESRHAEVAQAVASAGGGPSGPCGPVGPGTPPPVVVGILTS